MDYTLCFIGWMGRRLDDSKGLGWLGRGWGSGDGRFTIHRFPAIHPIRCSTLPVVESIVLGQFPLGRLGGALGRDGHGSLRNVAMWFAFSPGLVSLWLDFTRLLCLLLT